MGPFESGDMIPLQLLEDHEGDLPTLDSYLLPVGIALETLPRISLSRSQSQKLQIGNSVLLHGKDAPIFFEEACAIHGDKLVAFGKIEKGLFHPKRVFRHATV